MTKVLIAGVSTRAAAESAARAGYAVTGLDAYADLDQHPRVQALQVPRGSTGSFTARGAARMADGIDCDAVMYLSPFENHPRAVERLVGGRALWGNLPDVLRRARDPLVVARALQVRGFASPAVQTSDPSGVGRAGAPSESNDWLLKPLKSGGGLDIRRWRYGARVPRGSYIQEVVDGIPASVVFVAARGEVVPLGISRQLIGEAAFGVTGYRYCGSILTAGDDPPSAANATLVEAACRLAKAMTLEFGLVGVNGVDFIVRDGVPYGIEINPRWCASMELAERAYGVSVFAAHARACSDATLPDFDLARARRSSGALGKAILFARRDAVAGDTRRWLGDETVRDVPHPGERIAAGQPVCTVFAGGATAAECHAALIRRADLAEAALTT